MKTFFLGLVLAAIPGIAGAEDWSGPYAGVSLADVTGAYEEFLIGDPTPEDPWQTDRLSGGTTGAFIGYNFQRGDLVFGAELAYARGEVGLETFTSNWLDAHLDLKARAGVAAGRTLVYGVVALSSADRYAAVLDDPLRVSGTGLGLGMDVLLGDRGFMGLEVLRRKLSFDEGDIPVFPGLSGDHRTTSVTLRGGIRF
jgi:outer membrane immunogenic protein